MRRVSLFGARPKRKPTSDDTHAPSHQSLHPALFTKQSAIASISSLRQVSWGLSRAAGSEVEFAHASADADIGPRNLVLSPSSSSPPPPLLLQTTQLKSRQSQQCSDPPSPSPPASPPRARPRRSLELPLDPPPPSPRPACRPSASSRSDRTTRRCSTTTTSLETCVGWHLICLTGKERKG